MHTNTTGGEHDRPPRREVNSTMNVSGADGKVLVKFTDVGYLDITPDVARTFAQRLLQAADKAEGKALTHMFIIPVGDIQ